MYMHRSLNNCPAVTSKKLKVASSGPVLNWIVCPGSSPSLCFLSVCETAVPNVL